MPHIGHHSCIAHQWLHGPHGCLCNLLTLFLIISTPIHILLQLGEGGVDAIDLGLQEGLIPEAVWYGGQGSRVAIRCVIGVYSLWLAVK